ncbi:sn-glycerol-3-phosphate ABC transporter ATP-binding protein UgpC [Alginatibacterium sediminis]|uniref:sn-glycerol-3-phosphate ABC transporter ATP-binding protein UgpC n=1 Tax=Alginatibacterium sediminis TaxID=2164068 RepID=A0A420E6X9_9ALTE|nr:sn-glycerol-3-phosphate ABC transporter ATP-binding protein UgpC [Alginatibacterium sediminis]RKF13235.1 sn-glycerol-3-phosphate ABC transporter ATP-binding protein UgpC [Alginatibacterium sediminis]
MTGLKLTNIKKSYGKTDVIHGVDLEVQKGEFIVFVGPSGCGKSTLLRMIAGLESITDGDLEISGERVNDLPAAMRGIAMVFQTYALYPHMTVYDNMAFGMRIAKADKAEIEKRVTDAADMLQLTPYLDRLPKALSGGQRQRVAIGRAIVRNPTVFLFDEPLSNLDAALRVATRIEIANLKEGLPDTTMVYVTHDQVEAMTLADRIVVLSAGLIEQVGTPLELYNKPANTFVAKFIGSPAMNISKAKLSKAGDSSVLALPNGNSFEVPISSAAGLEGQDLEWGVRPEDMLICQDNDTELLSGSVMFIESLGEVTLLHIDCGGEDSVVAKLPGIADVKKGDQISLTAPADKLHVFDNKGVSFLYL